ncbi:MAG: type IV toxin-antitoxin system AbiEi family antitoxin domain-containing protein [bacterium]|nr:type IV toxin-antitoxin system AbiEi family antitoxin domain-containing protein [bacterium]
MTKREYLEHLFQKHGILSVQDVEDEGVGSVYFSRLCAEGMIDRIGHGVYSCPAYASSEHISYVEATKVVPRGVVCLSSALKFHGLTLENPHRLDLAILKGSRIPKHELPLNVYHFSPASYAFGITSVDTRDGRIQVYSVEKTIADCFKFRHEIGLNVAIAALKEAKEKHLLQQDHLWEALTVCRVARVARPYLEGLYV